MMRNAHPVLALLLVAAGCKPIKQPPKQPDQPPAQQTAVALDAKALAAALGRTGAVQAGDVYRVGFPRSDLHVRVQGVAIRPVLALGSWVAFKAAPGGAVVAGDLVLTEDEVTRVVTRLQEGGVEVSAMHNHLLRETPRVVYVHLHALGDPLKVGQAIRRALALTRTPPAAPPPRGPAPGVGLDTAAIASILGQGGKVNGGVYQVSVPRPEPIYDGGVELPPTMGVATALNFQATGRGQAAVAGDFVLLPSEVAPVMRALSQHGIGITALHSHFVSEEPRLLFMHVWATGDVTRLARGLRAALEESTKQRRS